MWASDPQLLVLGRTLRGLRRERDLSQEALASLAGVSPQHVSVIERGNKDLRLTTFLRLADGLGMGADELMAEVARAIAERSETRV